MTTELQRILRDRPGMDHADALRELTKRRFERRYPKTKNFPTLELAIDDYLEFEKHYGDLPEYILVKRGVNNE